jgi:hypothetical protein
MSTAQWVTLIIAIAGVLHGPLLPAIIGKVRKAGKAK